MAITKQCLHSVCVRDRQEAGKGQSLCKASLEEDYLQELVVIGEGRNGFKMKENRLRSDSRKKFFTMGVVRHQNRLHRELVDVLCLEMSRTG